MARPTSPASSSRATAPRSSTVRPAATRATPTCVTARATPTRRSPTTTRATSPSRPTWRSRRPIARRRRRPTAWPAPAIRRSSRGTPIRAPRSPSPARASGSLGRSENAFTDADARTRRRPSVRTVSRSPAAAPTPSRSRGTPRPMPARPTATRSAARTPRATRATSRRPSPCLATSDVKTYRVTVDGTDVPDVDGTSIVLNGLRADRRHVVVVRAVDAAGNVGEASARRSASAPTSCSTGPSDLTPAASPTRTSPGLHVDAGRRRGRLRRPPRRHRRRPPNRRRLRRRRSRHRRLVRLHRHGDRRPRRREPGRRARHDRPRHDGAGDDHHRAAADAVAQRCDGRVRGRRRRCDLRLRSRRRDARGVRQPVDAPRPGDRRPPDHHHRDRCRRQHRPDAGDGRPARRPQRAGQPARWRRPPSRPRSAATRAASR